MLNSDAYSGEDDAGERRDAGVDAILRSGARGGLALAGIATTVVIGIWFLFYLLVFLPRATGP
jgi:hypothetical protein